MRHCILFVLVSIVSIGTGMLLRPSDDLHSSRFQTRIEQPCVAPGDRPDASKNIDDRQITQQIQRAGGAIAETGTATAVAELIKQLSVRKCDLDLAHVTLKPAEGGLLYEQVKQSVVVVSGIYKCDRCNNWHAACATGFVISSSGAIVTNYHVVDNSKNSALVARTADGKVLAVKRVLAANKADDIAILELDVQDEVLTPLPVAKSRAPVGSNVSVISHPSQRFYCYTSGVISRYTRLRSDDEPANAMTITADFARGSSGGPVLNANGEVVGIVRSTESIYYKVDKGQQKNLQMVFKTCVPAASLLNLISG
jgi:S1-C subfamily serine protease